MTLVLMLTTSLPALAADTPSEEVAAPSEVSHVPLEDAAQTACTAAMAYGAADSISWAVWEEGEITTSGSLHGQRDAAQASAGAVYGIGSVSKIFTTTAVMQLVDQHRISLDAPVTQYHKGHRCSSRLCGVAPLNRSTYTVVVLRSDVSVVQILDAPFSQAESSVLLDRSS